MGIFDSIFDFASNLMAQTGYAGVFVLMVMESATLPVPSEIVLPLAGFLVSQGQLEFWTTVVVATLGSLVGTMVDYAIGYRLGRPAILRYGRLVRLSERHLANSEAWFAKHGEWAALLARFVPLMRTVIAFPAGLAKMPIGKFLVYSTIGIFVWDVALIYVGVVAGQNADLIAHSLESTFTIVGISAIIVTGLVLFAFSKRHKKNLE